MSRDTPPHLSSPGRGDDTDPSALPDITDPDGPAFDAIDAAETSDAVDAFEQRRRIYPQRSTSSSSAGSVAATYHTVHEVPRAHHDTRPEDLSSAPVVVRPVTGPEQVPAMPPAAPPAPAAGDARDPDARSARDVSTFPLPRRSPSSWRLPVVAASALVAAGIGAWVLMSVGASEPSVDAGAELPAVASVTSRLFPTAAAVTALAPLAASATASVSASPSANAPYVGGDAAGTAIPATRAQPARTSAPLPARSGGQPPARPGSSSSSTTPASARPAGDFDDLVREGKP